MCNSLPRLKKIWSIPSLKYGLAAAGGKLTCHMGWSHAQNKILSHGAEILLVRISQHKAAPTTGVKNVFTLFFILVMFQKNVLTFSYFATFLYYKKKIRGNVT